jgi:uncharacterized membrane protein YeaQ/YmgE (transglycosylase-associated protein family)
MSILAQPIREPLTRREKGGKIMALATFVLGVALEPGGLLAWLVVGLVAGFLASMVMRGGGYGILGDIIVGVVGAFIGGLLASLLGFGGTAGLLGSIVIAFIGACILIAILRAVSGGYRRRAL